MCDQLEKIYDEFDMFGQAIQEHSRNITQVKEQANPGAILHALDTGFQKTLAKFWDAIKDKR